MTRVAESVITPRFAEEFGLLIFIEISQSGMFSGCFASSVT
jgi:hypothetical protein